jgi:hypothetical protein
MSCFAPSDFFEGDALPPGFLPDLPDELGPLHTSPSSADLKSYLYSALEYTGSRVGCLLDRTELATTQRVREAGFRRGSAMGRQCQTAPEE